MHPGDHRRKRGRLSCGEGSRPQGRVEDEAITCRLRRSAAVCAAVVAGRRRMCPEREKEDTTRDALLPPESGKRVEQVKNEYVTLDLPPGWSVLQRTDQERGLCCLMAISKKDGTLMWIVVGADAGVLKTAFFGPLHKELEHTGSKESTSGKSRQQKNPGWQD